MSNAVSARYPVNCRACGADIGEPCRSKLTRRVTDTHAARIDDANIAHLVYEATFTSLKKTFEAAAKDRSSRQDRVVGPDGRSEPAWVAHERAVMRAAVDRLRAIRGREPVGDDEFARAEERAVGHVDYWRKFPLYCADLVVGES